MGSRLAVAAVILLVVVAAADALRGGGAAPPAAPGQELVSPEPATGATITADLVGMARMIDGSTGEVIYCPPPWTDASGDRVYADEDACISPADELPGSEARLDFCLAPGTPDPGGEARCIERIDP